MTETPRVALVSCHNYDRAQVESGVRRVVESLGGITKEAGVRLVQEAGGIPVIGDSPGGKAPLAGQKIVGLGGG